jgi:hypothetical protein
VIREGSRAPSIFLEILYFSGESQIFFLFQVILNLLIKVVEIATLVKLVSKVFEIWKI